MAVTDSSDAKINRFYWITSLSEEHIGTSIRTLDSIHHIVNMNKIHFEEIVASSKSNFIACLNDIFLNMKDGVGVIIHIDMHGSLDSGLIISQTNEAVFWNEFYEVLLKINRKSLNNTIIISAACFSFNVLKEISIDTNAPFYILIAPRKETNFGFVEENLPKFYNSFFAENDIIRAYELTLKEEFDFFHSEAMFFMVIVDYFRKECTGQGKKKRIDRLITEALKQDTSINKKQIKIMRKTFKKEIRPNKEVFEKYQRSFLLQRSVSLQYEEVYRYLKK